MPDETNPTNDDATTTQSTTAPAATTTSPAQGAVPTEMIESIAKAVHDKVFASLRRDGALPKQKPTKTAPAPTSEANPNPPNYRALDRALAATGRANSISEAAYDRLERAFAEDSPEDARKWVDAFFADFGAPASSTTNTATTTTAAPQSAATTQQRPASDRGSPQAPKVPLEEQDLVTMSESDRKALRAKIGDHEFSKRLMQQLSGRTIQLRR